MHAFGVNTRWSLEGRIAPISRGEHDEDKPYKRHPPPAGRRNAFSAISPNASAQPRRAPKGRTAANRQETCGDRAAGHAGDTFERRQQRQLVESPQRPHMEECRAKPSARERERSPRVNF
jgi:hypothetical protein